MTLDELQTEMRGGFKKVEERFNQNDDRFNKIDDRFNKIDDRFNKIDDRFTGIDDRFTGIDDRFTRIDNRLEKIEAELLTVRAEIKSEAESTRRHFDIMVEKMADSVKIVAEGTAHHSLRLDNHETRIKRLEKRRGQ